MGLRQLALRLTRLEVERKRPACQVSAVPEVTEEYAAEVCQLLMQYGLYASEEALWCALEQQAREYGSKVGG